MNLFKILKECYIAKKQPINRYWEDSARLLASVKLDYRATDDAIMLRILDKGIIQLSCRDDETWQKKRFSFTPEKTVQVLNLLQSFFPLKKPRKIKSLCDPEWTPMLEFYYEKFPVYRKLDPLTKDLLKTLCKYFKISFPVNLLLNGLSIHIVIRELAESFMWLLIQQEYWINQNSITLSGYYWQFVELEKMLSKI